MARGLSPEERRENVREHMAEELPDSVDVSGVTEVVAYSSTGRNKSCIHLIDPDPDDPTDPTLCDSTTSKISDGTGGSVTDIVKLSASARVCSMCGMYAERRDDVY